MRLPVILCTMLTAASMAAVNTVFAPPLSIPLELSANFAELRPNHFHGGVDFKTQGRIGLPIYAPADGYISRIEVSPSSYGNALFITHPVTGYTTVYGHLDRFNPDVEALVVEEQMRNESFSVSITPLPYAYPVKRGEQIAISGNTGHSGGPHLHFEVRETFTGYNIDPLIFYSSLIRDTRAPYVKETALYAKPGEGAVDGKKAWGRIYPSIRGYDAMDGQSNIYGVKEIKLWVDGELFFARTLNRFKTAETRAINTLVHYPTLLNDNKWMEWTRLPFAMPFSDGTMSVATVDGALVIDEERDYRCVYELIDFYGNKTKHKFTIQGRRMPISPLAKGTLLPFYKGGTLSSGNVTVNVAPGTFYDNVTMLLNSNDDGCHISLAEGALPVAKPFEIMFSINPASVGNPNKLVVVKTAANGARSALPTSWRFTDDGMLTVSGLTTTTGNFAIAVDEAAPVIEPKGDMSFEISDNLAGICDFRAEIDGRFVVMEYDLKNRLLKLKRGMKRPAGSTFKLWVIDNAGNVATYIN